MMSDWKETCAKCKDGEIEPRHCEYYGEPNGCNSPTYGEHPPVGNAAAMREAVETALTTIRGVINGIIARTNNSVFDCRDKLKSALSAPARNCDRFKTRKEARQYFDDVVCLRSNGCGSIDCKGCSYDSIDYPHRADCREQWLFAPAAERKGEGDGSK